MSAVTLALSTTLNATAGATVHPAIVATAIRCGGLVHVRTPLQIEERPQPVPYGNACSFIRCVRAAGTDD